MTFLFPGFLIAALAIAIPVIIHLFFFKKFKKVYFPDIRFLKELKEQTSHRSKLRNLLVLLSRCIVLLGLVLAFAQPYISRSKNAKVQTGATSIYVDNSFSMNAEGSDVPLIEEARRKAREIIRGCSETEKIQVITNDFFGYHQRLVNKEEALGYVDQIVSSPHSRNLSKVLLRQKQALQNAGVEKERVYLISDFQKSISDFAQWNDTTLEVVGIPLNAVAQRNLSIDSCQFVAPALVLNQPNPLLVYITNSGDDEVSDVRISTMLDGQDKPVGSVRIKPKSSIVDTVNVSITKTGWQQLAVHINDYPVTFDDTYYLSFHVTKEIRILHIYESAPSPRIAQALAGAPYCRITSEQVKSINYGTLESYQLIILEDLSQISSGMSSGLSTFIQQGGNLLIFPAATATAESYRTIIQELQLDAFSRFDNQTRQVHALNTNEFIFKDVFINTTAPLRLPETKGNFLFQGNGAVNDVIMRYRDGSSYLRKYPKGSGSVYFCAAPFQPAINSLNTQSEIFVPLIYKCALGGNKTGPIQYTIGKDHIVEIPVDIQQKQEAYTLKHPKFEFIPGQHLVGSRCILNVENQIPQDGVYALMSNTKDTIALSAFNYDRIESRLSFLDKAEMQKINERWPHISFLEKARFQDLGEMVRENNTGIQLWKWFVVIALVFLVLESILLRFWKI